MATDAPQSGPVAPAGQLDLKSAPMPEVEDRAGLLAGRIEHSRGNTTVGAVRAE